VAITDLLISRALSFVPIFKPRVAYLLAIVRDVMRRLESRPAQFLTIPSPPLGERVANVASRVRGSPGDLLRPYCVRRFSFFVRSARQPILETKGKRENDFFLPEG
jgi:hypothetical protein